MISYKCVMCETPNYLECSKKCGVYRYKNFKYYNTICFPSCKEYFFYNKQGCFLYCSAFFYENIACVIKILQSFVKISGGITISASQPDVTVNIWKKDVTN